MKRAAVFLLVAMTVILFGAAAAGTDVEAEYLKLKKDYLAFLKEDGKKVYRHNWLRHIDRFRRLQKLHPKAARADDALYTAGGAYVELYAYSYLKSDLNAAVTIYEQLVLSYPKSNLADDALVFAGDALEKAGKPAEAWKRFDRCASAYPKGDLTPKAVTAKKRLAAHAPKAATKTAAKSTPAPKPMSKAAATPTPTPVPEPTPEVAHNGPVAPPQSAEPAVSDDDLESLDQILAETTGNPAILGVQHWTNPDYTRIVIELSAETTYTHNLLEQQPGSSLPRRLYLDFNNAVIGGRVAKETPIADGLLQQVRVGQFSDSTARVVLDIESIDDFQIFPLLEPFRVVIDVQGRAKTPTSTPPDPKTPKTWTVVIDAGHGGKDTGAMSRTRERESLLTLQIARAVHKELSRDPHIKPILTRDTDVFLTLPQRPAIANKAKADLFVSVHINAARNTNAFGIETFHFSPKAAKEDYSLVAAENATGEERVEQMNALLNAIALSYKKVESNHLATLVQQNVLKRTRAMHRDIIDRHVRSAPFYVLLGAKMPAILVECGFITNKTELTRMKNPKYQQALAKGIADGVREYLSGYN